MAAEVPYYSDYLPSGLLKRLDAEAVPAPEGPGSPRVPGLRVNADLLAAFPNIDTPAALRFVTDVYDATRHRLAEVLALRGKDRAFIDDYTREAAVGGGGNDTTPYLSPSYDTVIGAKDSARMVRTVWHTHYIIH